MSRGGLDPCLGIGRLRGFEILTLFRTKILLRTYPVSNKRVGQERNTIFGFTLQEFKLKLFNKPFKSEKSCSMCLVSSKLFSVEKCRHYVSSSKEFARCLAGFKSLGW